MAGNKLNLSLVMDMVDKITGPIQKVTSQTTKCGEKIKATQDQLAKLGNQSKDIEKFKKLKQATASTSKQLNEAQVTAQRLAKQLGDTAKPTRKMTSEFNKAQKAAADLKTKHGQESIQLQEMRGKLNKAGISTKNLASATNRIKKETISYTNVLKKEHVQLDKIAKQQERIGKIKAHNSKLKTNIATDSMKVGAAGFGVTKLVQQQGEISSAQGEIKSLGLSDSEVAAITSKAKEYSNAWAGTSQAEFIKASYDIKSGIASLSAEAVGEFTKIAALTATATKSSVGEMTALFATGYGIYNQQFQKFGETTIAGWDKLSQGEKDAAFGTYFSDGIAASVQQFKTDGGQMQGAISALGATATSSNVPFAEQLSILGQLQATMSGSEAATKYKSFLNAAAGASDKLGLSFMDSNDQLLSMPDILQTLKDKYGETLSDINKQELKSAFGSDEAMALITQLYPEIDTLKTNITSMNGSLVDGGKNVTKMATAISAGPNESMELMNQRVGNATAAIGKLFVPALMFCTDIIGQAAMGIASFTENFPILSKVLAIVVVTIMMLKTVLIGTRIAQLAYSSAQLFGIQTMGMFNVAVIKNNALLMVAKTRAIASATATGVLNIASKAFAIGTGIMTAAQWALNAAMLANPIGLVILAVMGLIALAAYFYDDWAGVGMLFSSLWDGIKSSFSSGWEIIKAIFQWTPLGMIIGAWEPLKGFFAGLWASITDLFSGAMEWITSTILDPINVIKDVLGGVWDSFFGGDNEISATIKKVTENVPVLTDGNVTAATVVDDGKGTVSTTPHAAIMANNQTSQTTSYKIGDIHVHAQPGMSTKEIAKEVARQLAETAQNASRQHRTLAID